MPILDFLTEYDPNDSESAKDIGIRLYAVMLYPTSWSWQRREEYIVFHKIKRAQMIARRQYGQTFASMTGDTEIDLWLSRLVDMQRTISDEQRPQVHAGSIVGRRLFYVAAIELAGKRGSFNKADKLINTPYAKNDEKLKDGDGHVIATSRTKIKEAWNDFQSVAHLWAAFDIFPNLYGDKSALNHLEIFIPLAEWFREFGETHNQKGGPNHGEPYLDQKATWRPPDSPLFKKLTEPPEILSWTAHRL